MTTSMRVAMVLLAGLSLQAHAQLTPQACLGAFLGLQFSFRNYDAYPVYFHNDSIVQLAQAGVYTGPDAIAEYVKFANPENPAIADVASLNQTFTLTDIVEDTCEFYLVGYQHYTFTELFYNGTLNVTSAFRVYLNTSIGKVDRINVFYDTDYLRWFGGMTALPAYQAWLCNEMESGCPSTWSFNNLSSQSECMSRLDALPATLGESASFDGDSQACRGLHGTLAGLNPSKHCPHISFAPQEDPSGAVKCQVSQNIEASELFTPQQVAFLQLFKAENSIPATGFSAAIPCDAEAVVCPNDQVCVNSVCAEPGMPLDNHTNVTDMNTTDMNASDDNSTTDAPDNSSTTTEESESSFAFSLSTCTAAFMLLLAACGSTPF